MKVQAIQLMSFAASLHFGLTMEAYSFELPHPEVDDQVSHLHQPVGP